MWLLLSISTVIYDRSSSKGGRILRHRKSAQPKTQTYYVSLAICINRLEAKCFRKYIFFEGFCDARECDVTNCLFCWFWLLLLINMKPAYKSSGAKESLMHRFVKRKLNVIAPVKCCIHRNIANRFDHLPKS